jgi:hypothetical protein
MMLQPPKRLLNLARAVCVQIPSIEIDKTHNFYTFWNPDAKIFTVSASFTGC